MRLIDADALIPMMKYATTDNEIGVFPILIGFNAIKGVIDDAPTIDAVEVGEYADRLWKIAYERGKDEAVQGEWIPCSERLPEEGEVVLITNKKGNVKHGQYRGCYPSDKVDCWWWKKNTTEEVIAWMPLPKPYEGRREP